MYGVALFICDTDGDYAVTNRVFDLLVEIDWKGSFDECAEGRAWLKVKVFETFGLCAGAGDEDFAFGLGGADD